MAHLRAPGLGPPARALPVPRTGAASRDLSSRDRSGRPTCASIVDDLRGLYERLLGGRRRLVLQPTGRGRHRRQRRGSLALYLRDPDGIILELFQPSPRERPGSRRATPGSRSARIETVPIRVPLGRVYRGSGYHMTHRSTVVTRVHTDEGIVGEAYAGDEDATPLDDRPHRPRGDRAAARRRGRASPIERCWELATTEHLRHPPRPPARARGAAPASTRRSGTRSARRSASRSGGSGAATGGRFR